VNITTKWHQNNNTSVLTLLMAGKFYEKETFFIEIWISLQCDSARLANKNSSRTFSSFYFTEISSDGIAKNNHTKQIISFKAVSP